MAALDRQFMLGQASKVAVSKAREDAAPDATVGDIPLHQALIRMRDFEQYLFSGWCLFTCLDRDAYHFYATDVVNATRSNTQNAFARFSSAQEVAKITNEKRMEASCEAPYLGYDDPDDRDFPLIVKGAVPPRGFRSTDGPDRRVWGPVFWSRNAGYAGSGGRPLRRPRHVYCKRQHRN